MQRHWPESEEIVLWQGPTHLTNQSNTCKTKCMSYFFRLLNKLLIISSILTFGLISLPFQLEGKLEVWSKNKTTKNKTTCRISRSVQVVTYWAIWITLWKSETLTYPAPRKLKSRPGKSQTFLYYNFLSCNCGLPCHNNICSTIGLWKVWGVKTLRFNTDQLVRSAAH